MRLRASGIGLRKFSQLLALMLCLQCCWAITSRAEHPAFKGMELYSWKEGEDWKFALVEGTNRRKTAQEVHLASFEGVPELKSRIAHLAKGEEVFWSSHGLADMHFPPESTLNDIKRFSEANEVRLQVDSD